MRFSEGLLWLPRVPLRNPRARRIKLSVDERGARLSLPLRASLVSGERFLHEHRDWLTAQFAAQTVHAGERLQRDATAALPLRGDMLPMRWQGGRATRLDVDVDARGETSVPGDVGAMASPMRPHPR